MRALWALWLRALQMTKSRLKGTAALWLSVHTVVGQGVPRAWVVPHGPWGMTVLIGQTLQNMMDGGSDLWDLMGP